jgi:hypothetical protein
MRDRPVGFFIYYRHIFGVKYNFRVVLLYKRLMVSMSVLIRMDLYSKFDLNQRLENILLDPGC